MSVQVVSAYFGGIYSKIKAYTIERASPRSFHLRMVLRDGKEIDQVLEMPASVRGDSVRFGTYWDGERMRVVTIGGDRTLEHSLGMVIDENGVVHVELLEPPRGLVSSEVKGLGLEADIDGKGGRTDLTQRDSAKEPVVDKQAEAAAEAAFRTLNQ